MRVWVFTVALFVGLATWGSGLLNTSYAPGTDQAIVGAGGPDNGPVSAMEDPFPPPKP